jgi:hypothetical protein
MKRSKKCAVEKQTAEKQKIASDDDDDLLWIQQARNPDSGQDQGRENARATGNRS